jgi:hypothetical protein
MSRTLLACVVLLLASCLPAWGAGFDYIAYKSDGITIDGSLDEHDWIAAQKSPRFSDLATGRPAWLDSRAAIMWDDKFLYIGFQLEETDVRAFLLDRDDEIYRDNDVEVFIDGGDSYYELEINAFATIYEVFWIWDDSMKAPKFALPEFNAADRRIMKLDGIGDHKHPRGMRTGILGWDMPGLKWAVAVDGTLNDPTDVDRGWSVEIAIPWKSLALLAGNRAIPPHDGNIWRIDCSRFQQYDRDGSKLVCPAGWAWKPHGAFDSHMPEEFPAIMFSTKPVKAGI